MNYADKAEQLRVERLEKERQERERQEQEKKAAAEKKRQDADIKMDKAKELAPLFKQFHGRKICGGRIAFEFNWRAEDNDSAVTLYTGSVGLSLLDQYSPNTRLFVAYFQPEYGVYQLERHQTDRKRPDVYTCVGAYKTADELMDGLAGEVSKL